MLSKRSQPTITSIQTPVHWLWLHMAITLPTRTSDRSTSAMEVPEWRLQSAQKNQSMPKLNIHHACNFSSRLQLEYISMSKRDKCCLIISIISETMYHNGRSEKNWIRHIGQLVLDGLLVGSSWDKGAGSREGQVWHSCVIMVVGLSHGTSETSSKHLQVAPKGVSGQVLEAILTRDHKSHNAYSIIKQDHIFGSWHK
jgi:hypothetical protein